jgi:integrase
MTDISYRGHRFPPIVIQHAVWLYLRFTLSYRDVEELSRRARLDVSYETVRSWVVAGITAPIGCHTFRATGITAYLANGGALEHAQEMAAHESPRTTKLYDRTKERLTQDEVERIRL